jgi:mRNA interferase RelE/StbE
MVTAVKYRLEFYRTYFKDLERIPAPFRSGIKQKIESLAHDPRPEGSIKLQGSKKIPLYRLRCGDYRVVYTIQDEILLVIVIELGHRKEIYR